MYAGGGSGFRRDVGAVRSHIRHVIRYDEGGARDCPSGSFHCLHGNFSGYYGGAAGYRQNSDSHVEYVVWRRGESGCSLAADIGSGHILGAAWASNLNFALVAAINIFFLYRNGIPFPVRDSLKILLASLCMGLAGKMATLFFMDKGSIVVTLLAGMVVSVLIYGTAVMLLGCMTREEAAQLPVIGKIIRKFWKG